MKYALVAALALLIGFFAAGNTDVLTQTFFPEETYVAQILLGGEKETPVPSPAIEFCSFAGVAVNSIGPIILNEVAWMGDEESFSNEWIELKNISNEAINVSGWQILDKDEQIKIILANEIDSGEFLVLRRGEDWSGNLRNSDEGLRLFSKDCDLVDEVLAAPDWPAGDNRNKLTMERAADFSWYTAHVSGGTPNKENSVRTISPISSINPTEETTSAPPPPPTEPATPGKININTAGYKELQKITGVGEKIAQRIIDYRNANGPFTRIEDIINVKGIGEVTFQKMRDEITL